MTLVLSIFPGIGLLDRAFEDVGFCIVRGPDLLWGGDVHRFHPPSGVFDGIIGGPPCQCFSRVANIVRAKGQQTKPNLIPEFERVIEEAMPKWFLMENVPAAPVPQVRGYWPAYGIVLNNRWFGAEQNRERRFSFGLRYDQAEGGKRLDVSWDLVLLECADYEYAVMASSSKGGAIAKSQSELRGRIKERTGRNLSPLTGNRPRRTVARSAELQGLPADFLEDAPFTSAGKYEVIGNGVPLPMGRAVARAVKRAIGDMA